MCVIFYVKWHDLSREEQQKYYEKARTERQKHMEMYPHWNARDNYRFGLKKKKRKRDKADDPGTKAFFFIWFLQWHALTKNEQAKYYDLAKRERQMHRQLYPGWTARDNYAKHKKKRRKRDKIRADSNAEGSIYLAHCDIFTQNCLIFLAHIRT